MTDAESGEFRQLLQDLQPVPPPPDIVARAHIPNFETYYADADLDTFWAEATNELVWMSPWRELRRSDDHNHTEWYLGGRCNITQNVLDRHADGANRDRLALIWLGEDGAERRFTFHELRRLVNRFTNVLRDAGVQKGERVCIYMPLVPEGMAAMLACARVGAVHSVVYAGLGAGALRSRLDDAGATTVIVTDVGYRRGKTIDLRRIADEAIAGSGVKHVILHRRNAATPLRRRCAAARSICCPRWRRPRIRPSPKRWRRGTRSSSSTPPGPRELRRGRSTTTAAMPWGPPC